MTTKMYEAASWLPYDGDDNRIGERFSEARAAVAEVFEAAIPFAVVAGGFDMADGIRLRTALRNAGVKP